MSSLTPSQWVHILVILLGALAASFAFLGYSQYAGVVSIFIAAVGGVGTYVGGLPPSTTSTPPPAAPAKT